MPLGNGDIGLNVWVEEGGDLLFYISKTDSWSEHCCLLKLGRIRIKLSPNPFEKALLFRQELKLKEGEVEIAAVKDGQEVTIRVWVDANQPVIRVEAEGKRAFNLEASLEVWRTQPRTFDKREVHGVDGFQKDELPIVYPDTILSPHSDLLPQGEREKPFLQGLTDRIVWYHRNEDSLWPITLTIQDLPSLVDQLSDPLLKRTFGGAIKGQGLVSQDPQRLKSSKSDKRFTVSIYALTAQTDSVEAWLKKLDEIITEIEAIDIEKARADHQKWWNDFWNRSWICVSGSEDADLVTRGYILQRFINAGAGRGAYPIKFNGSIFTVEARQKDEQFDADYRRWGGAYWFQNTRLPYWSMLYAGDFDLMRALFNTYRNAMPLAIARTRIYYNHDGAFFPETMYFWGTYFNGGMGYGWERQGKPLGLTDNTFIRYYWSGGLELAVLMLEYYEMTQDAEYFKAELLPLIDSIMTFYDQHWKRDQRDKIRFDPAQSLETWHVAVNPLPEIAGLKFVLTRLLELPHELTTEAQRNAWTKTLCDLPELPTKTEDGKKLLLPAETYDKHSNVENPELYAIFPYRLFGLGKPELEVALETWERRRYKRTGGWTQDPIQAAYLGLTETAVEYTVQNFSKWHEGSRFPAFWGPNFDWIPDQDHGCVAMIALQRMLMQAEGKTILLFPAWPKEWNVEFKLQAPFNTIVEGVYHNGKLERLKVTPEARTKDVIIMGNRQ